MLKLDRSPESLHLLVLLCNTINCLSLRDVLLKFPILFHMDMLLDITHFLLYEMHVTCMKMDKQGFSSCFDTLCYNWLV